jgi:hypothetical protein
VAVPLNGLTQLLYETDCPPPEKVIGVLDRFRYFSAQARARTKENPRNLYATGLAGLATLEAIS